MVILQVLNGERLQRRARVASLVDELVGLSAYTDRPIFLVITDSVDPAPRHSWSPKRVSFLANCPRNIGR